MAEAKGDRIAIVGGARSPFAKSWSSLNDVDPVELSTQVALAPWRASEDG